jgi:hypothetical protein
MRDDDRCNAPASAFLGLEDRLFAWDADESTRCADAFVRASLHLEGAMRTRTVEERAPIPFRLPDAPGSYARRGGETIVVRANDLALAMAVRLRAA